MASEFAFFALLKRGLCIVKNTISPGKFPLASRIRASLQRRDPMVQLFGFLGPESEEKYHRAFPQDVCFQKMCWEG